MAQLAFSAALRTLARDAAIDRVEAAAREDWKEVALMVVEVVARDRELFTTDHVWAVMPGDVSTPEPRAMGAIMRRAAREGYVTATDRHVLSNRPLCHRRPVRVWRSLIYREGE